jgi:hypothetical protein
VQIFWSELIRIVDYDKGILHFVQEDGAFKLKEGPFILNESRDCGRSEGSHIQGSKPVRLTLTGQQLFQITAYLTGVTDC